MIMPGKALFNSVMLLILDSHNALNDLNDADKREYGAYIPLHEQRRMNCYRPCLFG